MSNPRFLMGSAYFFRGLPGFRPKDVDFIELIDNPDFAFKRTIRGQGKDIIQLRRLPKDVLISTELQKAFPLSVGKYLIPEFCSEIGFTTSDLLLLKPLIDSLDPKHSYEALIYQFYLQNNSFSLSEEQRLIAFASYCHSRNIPTKEV